MKKGISLILAVILVLGSVSFAWAEAPAEASRSIEMKRTAQNLTWSRESYPEIWLTPYFAEYIIENKDSERYPAKFLAFTAPENALAYEFRYDRASFIEFEDMIDYSYYIASRASFELFLEKAEKEHILADGSGDGIAMYVDPDKNRAYAMLSLEDQFGGTAKLEIVLYDYTRNMNADKLSAIIQAETERVASNMQVEDLAGYWSEKVYTSVQLYYSFLNIGVTVDTSDMTLVRANDSDLTSMVMVDDQVRETKIEVTTYVHDEAVEATLADGTPYLLRATEYSSTASFVIGEARENPVYVAIGIGGSPEECIAELENVYPLVSILEL